MNKNATLLTIGIWSAFGCISTSAYEYLDYLDKFPVEHLGARHILFSGTHTILETTDAGTPTPDGNGFREAKGKSELTLSVPDLGITDLTLALSYVSNADLDAGGNGTTWSKMDYRLRGISNGVIESVGTRHQVSDTLVKHTRQYGGCLTGGPLDGANLFATDRIEETTDSNGTVVTRVSVIKGILIVPFYTDFPPFKDMESLPPLKPITEIPSDMGWRICDVEESIHVLESISNPNDHVYYDSTLSCSALDVHDLWIPVREYGKAQFPVGRRYGNREFLPSGPGGGSCGETAWQGVLGRSNTPDKKRYDYMDHTGVFWSGPFAGCLFLHSVSWTVGPTVPFALSTILLIPEEADHDSRAPQKMLNVSERGRVGIGDDVLIAGFVVSGNLPKMMLVRGVGPTLGRRGVSDFLADPVLQVYRSTATGPVLVGSNDNWASGDSPTQIRDAFTEAGAFTLIPHSKDAALLFSWLEPGVYTAQVSSADGTTGVALAEVYEIGN